MFNNFLPDSSGSFTATKVCEERIGQKSDAIKFVRYLGGKFDNSNSKSARLRDMIVLFI